MDDGKGKEAREGGNKGGHKELNKRPTGVTTRQYNQAGTSSDGRNDGIDEQSKMIGGLEGKVEDHMGFKVDFRFGEQGGETGVESSISRLAHLKADQRGNKLLKNPGFDWGYPRKPPFQAWKLFRITRSQPDSSGKRVLPPTVLEMTGKMVRPRLKVEEVNKGMEEEEVVSLVESTFKEGDEEEVAVI